MPNHSLEQRLVDSFICALRRVQDRDLSIQRIHNSNCKSRTFADLEFIAMSGQRWAIEAKYGAPSNKANEVHKLFGDLLRETGRDHRQNCKIGLLLHGQRENYFRNGVRRISRQKFARFGQLVPVQAVFVLCPLFPPVIKIAAWLEFYDGIAGRQVR